MKAIIVEDEKAAVRNLTALLEEEAPDIRVITVLDSITETIEWFRTNPSPDLVFMDIHLADGSAFEIFEYVKINCPVIFTTAYDEYALKAFKVNSIDYLLKPIGPSDICQALDKLKRLQTQESGKGNSSDYHDLLETLKKKESYKSHFLVPVKGDKLLPLPVENILFFQIHDKVVRAITPDGKAFIFSQTLDELNDCLNPALFFRANRQYLISRKAIKDVDLWFNSRLSVNLIVPTEEKIVVSKARVAEFKEWFTGE